MSLKKVGIKVVPEGIFEYVCDVCGAIIDEDDRIDVEVSDLTYYDICSPGCLVVLAGRL